MDVFENEPHPEIQLLMKSQNKSLTPHIGAANSGVSQDRIGTELAEQIIRLLHQ